MASQSSLKSALSFTASVKNEICDSEVNTTIKRGRERGGRGERLIDFMIHLQVASQLEQDEPERTADGISDDIAFTEAPRSISKSSLRSKASRTSITSATGSRVSETFTQEVHLHSNNNYYHTPSMNYNTISCINLIITSIPLHL